MFECLLELTPKDDEGGESAEVKSPTDYANELLNYILNDIGLKGMIYN